MPDGERGGPVATAEVLSRVDALLDLIDHEGRRRLDAEARVSLVESVVALGRRVEALRAVLVGEADRARAADAARGTSLRSLLSTTAQVSSAEASGWVYAGKDLVGREGVRRAALAGTVSVGQARAIDGVLGELPATLDAGQRLRAEQVLLVKAHELDAKALAGQARAVLEEVAPHVDAVEDELQRLDHQRRQAHATRALAFVPDGKGSVLIRGQLPVLDAAPFERLVAAYTDADRASRDAAADRRAQHDRLPEIRTPQQRRADGLIALIRAHADALAGAPSSGRRGRRVAGDRPRVTVTMDFGRLRDHAEQAGILPDGTPVSAGELRRLLCDAELVPAVLGGASEILDVGRGARLVTPEIRRALALRDGGCAFPGCGALDPACEAHHITPWWAGGETALSNLVLLCPHHHGTVEPLRFWRAAVPRWQVSVADDGHPEFLPPRRAGVTPTPLRHQRTRTRVRGLAVAAAVTPGRSDSTGPPGPRDPQSTPEPRTRGEHGAE